MAGRLGHIADQRRIAHIPTNGLRKTNYAYGFSNVQFQLDASEKTSTKTDAAAISSWQDIIRGIILTQGTGANQPSFTLSDANFNNYSSVVFGAADFLNFPFALGFPLDYIIAVVYKINTIQATGNNLFRVSASTDDANTDIIGLNRGVATQGEYIRSFGTQYQNTTTNDTNPHISIFTPTTIYRDGASVATGLTAERLNGALVLGTSATGRQLASSVAEIIIYSNSLSDSQLISLSDNINSKYAIY